MKTNDSETSLRIYNLFPYRKYADTVTKIGIDDMIAYLPNIAEMGFNAIWINPLQLSGNVFQIHPGHGAPVHGSLYAMIDCQQFNPLIFPDMSVKECEDKIKNLCSTAKSLGLTPLFDLVLNHIGKLESGKGPIEERLGEDLIETAIHSRWPDIKPLNYYQPTAKKKGINANLADLDLDKIDLIFDKLWTPFIRKYIEDYGFMGARVDALVHVPVYVQNKAYALIQDLVQTQNKCPAIILGELMSANFSPYENSLGLCNMTHCMNPYSFYWSPDHEGGYAGDEKDSNFLSSITKLKSIFSPKAKTLKLELLQQKFDPRKHQSESTIFISYLPSCLEIVILKSRYLPSQIFKLSEPRHEALIMTWLAEFYAAPLAIDKQNIKAKIHHFLLDLIEIKPVDTKIPVQLVAVLGNHDVGTLAAKTLIDLVYHQVMRTIPSERLKYHYTELKQLYIKSSRNLDELKLKICECFSISSEEVDALYLDLLFQIQTKIFVQAMFFKNYYILAGDEAGMLRKPDVFTEYGQEINSEPHCSLTSQSQLSSFFHGLHQILDKLKDLDTSFKLCEISIKLNDKLSSIPVIGYFCPNTLSQNFIAYSPIEFKTQDHFAMIQAFIKKVKMRMPSYHPVVTQVMNAKGLVKQEHFFYPGIKSSASSFIHSRQPSEFEKFPRASSIKF